jgi:hypothetical protein
MRRGMCVGVLLLAVLGLLPAPLLAQSAEAESDPPSNAERGFRLEQNDPDDAVDPTTRIRFFLDDKLFEGGGSAVVTVRIYDVLQQPIAVPLAMRDSLGNSVPADAIEYITPGRKEVVWDGLDSSGRRILPGLYYIQLVVNGVSQLQKTIVGSR